MTATELVVPPMRAIIPSGAADAFHEWINERVVELLADHEEVVVVYCDGTRDRLEMGPDGEPVTISDGESPEAEPDVEWFEVADLSEEPRA